jgi:tetratricopeptide (TPR) repeat protein
LGEHDAALLSLKQVVRLDPGDADALWALARLYDEQLGLKDQADKSYREFERLFPGDPRVLKIRARFSDAGSTRPPGSGTETPRGIGLKPGVLAGPGARRLAFSTTSDIDRKTAIEAYNRGRTYQEQKSWERAVFFYTRAIENDPAFANAYYNLGLVYRAKGDLDLAMDAYRRLLDLQPDMSRAHFNLALIHYDLKQYEKALEALKKVLQGDPDYAAAHYMLGLIYSRDRWTYNLARQHYTKFVEMAPEDPLAEKARRWLAGS